MKAIFLSFFLIFSSINVFADVALPLIVEKAWKLDSEIIVQTQCGKFTFQPGSRKVCLNGTTFWLSYPISVNNGIYVKDVDWNSLLQPVFRNKGYSFNTIVIDPGHGGIETGTIAKVGKISGIEPEKFYTLAIALRLREILLKRGFNVVMTRTRDEQVTLEERARISNQHVGALFVSIHFNEGGNIANGIETYYMTPQGGVPTNSPGVSILNASYSDVAARCAFDIHSSLVKESGFECRGVKSARFAVLRLNQNPAVLVECGFLSNPLEAARVNEPMWQNKIALGIANGIWFSGISKNVILSESSPLLNFNNLKK